VRFLEKDGAHRGQGVLVPGPWIVTAAHVLHWDYTRVVAGNGNFNEEEFLQEITVAGGSRFRVYPQAVEPVHDLAVLGAVDGQWLPHDDDAFDAFCSATLPVPLATEDFYSEQDHQANLRRMRRQEATERRRTAPAYVLAHTGAWIRGRVRQFLPKAPSLVLETETLIQGGTSGSPVVTADGRLLGVASWVGVTTIDGKLSGRPDGWANGGTIPRPHRAAPLYLVEQMTAKTTRKKNVAAR
jgi:hypothetical protein